MVFPDNLLKEEEPKWIEEAFTPFGKWMDGWESRRRRTEGYDWCIIKLGLPGIVRAIEVDTIYFSGNYSPKASILCTYIESETPAIKQLRKLRSDSVAERPEYGRMGLKATEKELQEVATLKSEDWKEMVPLSPLGAGYKGESKTLFKVPNGIGPITHIRLNQGPDGGIARIKVHGEVVIPYDSIPNDKNIDLVAVENGK